MLEFALKLGCRRRDVTRALLDVTDVGLSQSVEHDTCTRRRVSFMHILCARQNVHVARQI